MRRRQGGRLGVVFALIGVLVVLVAGAGVTLLFGRIELEAAGSGSPVLLTVRSGESPPRSPTPWSSRG